MSTTELQPGASIEVAYTVAASDSPRNLRLADGDEFPDVLATAKMVGLLEVAAARLLKPLLKEGELSVGVEVNVKHLAPTPLFTAVTARATFTGMEGKLYRFEVELLDVGGCAARGMHTRAIVGLDRLMEGARRRIPAAS